MTNDDRHLDTLLKEFRALDQFVRTGAPNLARQHIQVEAYISLVTYLRPNFPFPPMGFSSIAPDLALLFATYILERKPSLILEAGSGVSTLIAGYCVSRNRSGKVISMEHDERFAAETARLIRLHGLQNQIQLIHAPLVNVEIRGEPWAWYDPSSLEMVRSKSIDLALIDGPPGDLRRLSRYPALPLLIDSLSDHALILIDDADRADEREMVDRWRREFPSFHAVHLPTEKGTCVLTAGTPSVESDS